jgi:predicted nuclease of predicted toxin-antitoxin system
VTGLLADANIQGQVAYLVQRMQAAPWTEFWQALGLVHRRFEDVGLSATATDLEIWNFCQTEQLILITDNRNLDSEELSRGIAQVMDGLIDRRLIQAPFAGGPSRELGLALPLSLGDFGQPLFEEQAILFGELFDAAKYFTYGLTHLSTS